MRISRPEPSAVRHYVAGSHEHGGGIGRLVGNILGAGTRKLHHSVVDTRGPRWNPLYSPFFLLGAMAQMAVDRIVAPQTLHQLHIAGRGSTARKLLLGSWARGLGCKYVLHLHDYDYAADFWRRSDWQRRAIRRLFHSASHVIVLGQRDLDLVENVLGVPPGRASVLRNCVADPGPRPLRQGDEVRILFLGQLGPRKGVPELLAALADPAMPQQGWHATLAGDGPVADYRRRAAALGLRDRVDLPGWLGAEETRALRAASDILVLPSHAEGFAMAVLEGLAQGLAVVTTRVGAHDEVLEHERDCLFVPVGDPEALARALSRLIADPTLRRTLGAGGRHLYLSGFDIEGYVRRLEGLQRGLGSLSLAAGRVA